MLILGGSTCAPITFLFVDQSSLFLPNARILVDFGGVCAIKLWSISSACANLREQHLLGAEIWSSDKLIYFVVSEPKFTWLFSSNAGRIAVDILVFRFSISRSVLEIFAVEVWSCPKSRRILHVLAKKIHILFVRGEPPQILGRVL